MRSASFVAVFVVPAVFPYSTLLDSLAAFPLLQHVTQTNG